MKSFLVKNKVPIIKWTLIPDEIFYEGEAPLGYSIAVCPSKGTVIIDVDRHGTIDGFDNIPGHLVRELTGTLNYPTKNNGRHYWFNYTGNIPLANKHSKYGIDLRTHKGYVVYYKEGDIRDHKDQIKETSPELNKWIEELFGAKTKLK